MTTRRILVLPGDGIGPEVMREARRVLDWLQRRGMVDVECAEGLVGGASIDAHETPLTDEVREQALAADAILFGAVGGPKWASIAFDRRPELGILGLRKSLDLFANLRPAMVFDALTEASALKPERIAQLDLMMVRELTGGIYFGEPRGIETLAGGGRRAVNTQSYTTNEIVRVAHLAFELARKRHGRVCSVEKANVMETGVLWREEVQALRDRTYPDVTLTHMYADNCAMQLVRAPTQFDVILTDNLFGDILSDLAAMLTGSLGMLPSASLGAPDGAGRRKALYEPIHGSAPDIAGKGSANPLAMILSLAMMLRYSFDLGAAAELIEKAVAAVLESGLRTADIMQPGKARVSTSVMGDAILRALERPASAKG
ncbi:MAG: 3-isopropylmalate dehydrogenase [Alphaproteobacteria bacterium]|nr:3-isopropylmalate dehydrogenase [Alphaproteobacteria bacterium]